MKNRKIILTVGCALALMLAPATVYADTAAQTSPQMCIRDRGLKRYQVENSRKLKEKWAEEFKKQCVNTGNPNPFRARERSQGKPVILVVDHYVPTFDKDAGSKTTYQYLKMFLKKGYVVKFLGDNFLHEEPYSTVLQQMGVEYGSS